MRQEFTGYVYTYIYVYILETIINECFFPHKIIFWMKFSACVFQESVEWWVEKEARIGVSRGGLMLNGKKFWGRY